MKYCTISNEIFQLEAHSLIDAVTAQDYDRGKNEILRLINWVFVVLVLDLLQSGVDPRIPDKYGRTPLHVASTKLDAAIGTLFAVN